MRSSSQSRYKINAFVIFCLFASFVSFACLWMSATLWAWYMRYYMNIVNIEKKHIPTSVASDHNSTTSTETEEWRRICIIFNSLHFCACVCACAVHLAFIPASLFLLHFDLTISTCYFCFWSPGLFFMLMSCMVALIQMIPPMKLKMT